VILIIVLPLINYFVFGFGWEWLNSIALFTSLISIIGIFYSNYKNDIRLNHQIKLNTHNLIINFNYDEMKKSIFQLKNFLKETIKSYQNFKKNEKLSPSDIDIENYMVYYIKPMNHLFYKLKFCEDKIKDIENRWYEYYFEMNNDPDIDESGHPITPKIEILYISEPFRELVESLENIEKETFIDTLPIYVQETVIKSLIDFINDVQIQYLKTSDDIYLANEIINKINKIISNLNLSKISEIIDNELSNFKWDFK
jgi:hypothetical protein